MVRRLRIRRLRIPPVALVDNSTLRRMQSRPVALDFLVLDLPVAIPVIEPVRVGEVDREVSRSLFILPDSVACQAILNVRLFCRSKITQDDCRKSVNKIKKPRVNELTEMPAKDGPKMSGLRQDLVLGETVRAADTAEIGHVVGRSFSQQGAHLFKEVVNNNTGGVIFRVYFGYPCTKIPFHIP